MKILKFCVLMLLLMLSLAFIIGCDSERYVTKPTPSPLPLWVAASVIPSTVEIGNPVGLIGDDSGGVAPYERSWIVGGHEIGIDPRIQYTADSIGEYLAWYHVQDADGRRDSARAVFTVIPKDTIVDSIPYPVYVVDTLIDSIPYPVTDTLEIIKWKVDTLYQVRVDTLWLSQVAYWECNPWILKWESRSDTVHLKNPAGKFWVHFDRQTLGAAPEGQGYVIRFIDSAGKLIYPEEFFDGFGPNYVFIGKGPYHLPANVTAVIELKDTYYGKGNGKVAVSPTCHDFIRGSLFCFVPADSTR